MQQYHYQNNILNLKVKKAPVLVRAVMFGLTFSFFVLPVLGVIFNIAGGSGLHFGYFINNRSIFAHGFLPSKAFIVEYVWRRNY